MTTQPLKRSPLVDCKSNVNLSAMRKIEHIDLDWDLDFEKQVICGSVCLTLGMGVGSEFELDIRELKIEEVRLDSRIGTILKWAVRGNENQTMGSLLSVKVPENPKKIWIKYETSPNAHALLWIEKEHTNTKIHPYLYSQCQATHCRSIIPCHDSPSVKQTFHAKIRGPKGIRVLMGAQTIMSDIDNGRFEFNQDVPIPSYLIAIAAGNIERREIGPRSSVWSEPGESLNLAEKDFEQVEDIIQKAEALLGPYIWSNYDILVLPDSFPYGGMENPCLTFTTPSIVTGDKSSINVIAHEIMHSWTGNLITNLNWEHFWLNEGHTRYLESKMIELLHGYDYCSMFTTNGFTELSETVNAMKAEGTFDLTRLVTDLRKFDTDNAFSNEYLETTYGKDIMLEFMRHLVETFKFTSFDTFQYKQLLEEFLKSKNLSPDLVDWNAWFHEPGMPPAFEDSYCQNGISCFAAIDKLSDSGLENVTESIIKGLNHMEIERYLNNLIIHQESERMLPKNIEKLNQIGDFSNMKNNELLFKWYMLCLRARYEPICPSVLKFLSKIHRMKYSKPIYTELNAWPEMRGLAVERFEADKDLMHPVARHVIQSVLYGA